MIRGRAALVVAATGVAVALALAGSGCSKASVATGDAPASRLDTPPPSTPPVDHLGPNELVEGTDRAFGVPLPRGLAVEQRYPDFVYATGSMPVHALVLYFRARLQGGALRESETVATFEHVTVAGLPPNTDLLIHLTAMLSGTRVEMSSTTHPPAPDLPDVAARWRQVGLTPNGKVLDPTHLD
jgi:hypothetical protein